MIMPLSKVVKLTKRCYCRGTSSGPRIIAVRSVNKEKGCLVIDNTLVHFACDVCDTPWGYGPKTPRVPKPARLN